MSFWDLNLSWLKIYRRLKKGTWYKHKLTNDASEICLCPGVTFWARYNKLNRYTDVVKVETYEFKN